MDMKTLHIIRRLKKKIRKLETRVEKLEDRSKKEWEVVADYFI